MEFSGKVVVITGAGSGLGRCLALQLGELGATIAGIDYNEASMQETARLLEAQSTPCSVHRADVSSTEDVARVVGEIVTEHGSFDVLINNAGIMQSFTTVADIDMEQIERLTQVNYWGMVLFVKQSLPILLKRPESMIVNISSLSALVPFPGQTIYSASKAAVRIFSEGLRLELKDKGVDVALVMPGSLRTPIAENSPYVTGERLEKMRELAEDTHIGLSGERAARKIIRALRGRKRRLILGADAAILDKLYRIAPITTTRLLSWLMSLNPLTATS